MVGFLPASRLYCEGFAHYRAIPLPDTGAFVFRGASGLTLQAKNGAVPIPDSYDPVAVTVVGDTIAWAERRPRTLRVWSARESKTVVAGYTGGLFPWSIALSPPGKLLVAGGHAWSDAHEEHAAKESEWEMGAPYLYGEIRPSIPPQPPLEPGLVGVWSLPDLKLLRVDTFKQGVLRVAVDSTGHSFGAWDESGAIEVRATSQGFPSQWRTSWTGSVLRHVPAAALLSGGSTAYWAHYTGVYRRDPIRGVRTLVTLEGRGTKGTELRDQGIGGGASIIGDMGPWAFSVVCRLAALGGDDGRLLFFSIDNGALVGESKLELPIRGLSFGEDGRRLAVVTDDHVAFGDIVSGLPVAPPIDTSTLRKVEIPKPAETVRRVASPAPVGGKHSPRHAWPERFGAFLNEAPSEPRFVLSADEYTMKALDEVAGEHLPDIVERARARLLGEIEDAAMTVDPDGRALWVRAPSAEKLERLVSAEPYVLGEKVVFLPFSAARVTALPSATLSISEAREAALSSSGHRWATLVWHGSMARSRLVLHGHSARIGGDASCVVRVDAVDDTAALVEQRGHHIYVDPLGGENRALFSGEWLSKRRFYGPRSMVIMPAPRRTPSVLVLFESTSQVPLFGVSPYFWETEGAGEWGNILLGTCIGAREPCGVVVIQPTQPHPDERWWQAASPPVADAPFVVAVDASRVIVAMQAPAERLDAYARRLRDVFRSAADVASAAGVAEESPNQMVGRALRGLAEGEARAS